MIIKETIIGIVCICIGIGAIYWAYKYPNKGVDMLLGDAKGYIGGILLIIIGILFIVGK